MGFAQSPTSKDDAVHVANDASDLMEDEEVDFADLENAAKHGLKKAKLNWVIDIKDLIKNGS